jgi:hypothetical protein
MSSEEYNLGSSQLEDPNVLPNIFKEYVTSNNTEYLVSPQHLYGKSKAFLCLTKYRAMKANGGVEV